MRTDGLSCVYISSIGRIYLPWLTSSLTEKYEKDWGLIKNFNSNYFDLGRRLETASAISSNN